MGEDTTRNMYSSFPEINKLCKVASRRKYIKTNKRSILTFIVLYFIRYRSLVVVYLTEQDPNPDKFQSMSGLLQQTAHLYFKTLKKTLHSSS